MLETFSMPNTSNLEKNQMTSILRRYIMKRTLSLVLAFCLVFSLFTGVLISGAGAITYTDVAKDFWAYNEIYYLTDKGILEGDGTGKFRPKDSVTHIEFIKMIDATFNLTDAVTVSYTNIPSWARDGRYVEKAAAQGFLLDRYTRDFDFTEKLSREEAVAMVMRYLNLNSNLAVSSSRYPDYNKINAAYREYALIATGAGIVQGDDTGNFQPDRILTRAEALRILYTAAGAIYDKSANRTDTDGNKTNATINHNANLSGINFSGNVYVTESVSAVTLDDCYINGELIIRGKTAVTLDDTVAANITVKKDGASVTLEDDTRVTTMNVNGTADIDVGKDSSIQKLLFNNGSKNSTVNGEGEVTNVAIQDTGITINGVDITEYYVYRGYTVMIDGTKYEAGSGKPVKNAITAAYVSGMVNYYLNNSSNITVSVTANTAGTVYVAAWPNTETALTAAQIRTAATSTTANRYGTSQGVAANVASTVTFSVPGSYESYNVGLVFIPTNASTTLTNVTAYYNKSTISVNAAAMVTTAPAAAKATEPTWTVSVGTTPSTLATDVVILTFNQPMGLRSSVSPLVVTDLARLDATTRASYFKVYDGIMPITIKTSSVSSSANNTVVYLTLSSALSANKTYTVAIDGNITNMKGVAPKELSKTFTGSSSSGSLTGKSPTLTSSSGSQNVSASDYIQIGFPEGVKYITYSVTVDGVKQKEETIQNYGPQWSQIALSNYPNASVIVVSAWSLNDNRVKISEPTTQTYYMGVVPVIYIDSTAFYGSNNNAYVTKTFYVSTSTVPAGYVATYTVTGYYPSTAAFDGSWAVPAVNAPITFTMTLTPTATVYNGKTVSTSVTVNFGNGSTTPTDPTVPTNPTGIAPTVSVNNNVYLPDGNYDVSGTSTLVSVSVPSNTYKYSYTVNGGATYYLENGKINSIALDSIGNTTKVIIITAVYGSSTVGSWKYTVNFKG